MALGVHYHMSVWLLYIRINKKIKKEIAVIDLGQLMILKSDCSKTYLPSYSQYKSELVAPYLKKMVIKYRL